MSPIRRTEPPPVAEESDPTLPSLPDIDTESAPGTWSEPPPTPPTPRDTPVGLRGAASLSEVPMAPTAPLDVRVTRLEARADAHDRRSDATDHKLASHARRLAFLNTTYATVLVQLEVCQGTINSCTQVVQQLSKQTEIDRIGLIRELGTRAQQDSIHDGQHAAHRAELGEVKKRLTWRQITTHAASKGVAGGLVFGAGMVWSEVWPLLVELVKKVVGH